MKNHLFLPHSGFVAPSWDRKVVLLLGLALLCTGLPVAANARAATPNVVLIMSDDQGYGDLGCHGNAAIHTPHLDRLHSESIRFTNFHVDPTCSPTRAALLTGRYSLRTGVWHTVMGRSLLREDEVTMADVFVNAGYRTGNFGKWHLGDNYPLRPQDRGFQEVLIHGGGGVGQTPDYWDNDYFDDTYFHNGRAEKFAGYCTDVWFYAAMKFMSGGDDRPFFVYLPTNAPHAPYLVADKYKQMYADRDVANPAFAGMITNLDENVGKLLTFLEERKLAENTIVIFMTDNGTAAGIRQAGGRTTGYNAGMRGQKGSPYDGGHRVPFFVRWPAGDLHAGRDVDLLAAHIDVLPTLVELCGLTLPERKLDGMSLVPLLRGDTIDWPHRTLVVDSQRIERPEKWRASAVLTDRWRLIEGKSLYDMHADPGQTEDISGKHPAVVEQLRREYENWWGNVTEHVDDFVEISIGSAEEPVTQLNCMDWHTPKDLPPWNQTHIRDAQVANGFWALRVERDGEYEFQLRRWPQELDSPIDGGPGNTVNADEARLQVGNVNLKQKISGDESSVRFVARLEQGNTRLQTWFDSSDGNSRGAYYVAVKRISD